MIRPTVKQKICWKEAEEVPVNLWNKIAEIRMVCVHVSPNQEPNFGRLACCSFEYPNPKKRKHPEISTDTPISTISSHITPAAAPGVPRPSQNGQNRLTHPAPLPPQPSRTTNALTIIPPLRLQQAVASPYTSTITSTAAIAVATKGGEEE